MWICIKMALILLLLMFIILAEVGANYAWLTGIGSNNTTPDQTAETDQTNTAHTARWSQEVWPDRPSDLVGESSLISTEVDWRGSAEVPPKRSKCDPFSALATVKGIMSRLYKAVNSAMAGLPVRLLILCAVLANVIGQAQKDKDGVEFVCPEGTTGNGNFADPATCRRFYQCVDGYPYLNRCPSGLYFDDISKFCTFKAEARCGPIPTTDAPITERPVDLAEKCDPEACQLPYCFCSKDGTIIPGGIDPEETPQMIMLTFDGAVNLNNFDLYKKVFNGKIKNPNGCPIRGTFFLSHEYSNYAMVQALAHDGHEMATGTISQQQGLQDKGYEEWAGEMIGMREILKRFANVSRSDVVGARAPFLKPGRNTQYKVLEDFGYIYDSSVGVPPLSIPVWPYTLDYKIPHECKSATCPYKQFPGLWEVPFNAHYVASFEGGHCPYLDQCVLHNHDAEDVLAWLQEDFARSYDQNRAPYMMPFHTNWFQIKELEQGLHKFLNWAASEKDVWFVTVTQALTWITDPKPVKLLTNYEPWKCENKELPPAPCNLPNKCAVPFKHPQTNVSDTRYMETCNECPKIYPWLGDSGGTGIPGKDNYIPDNLRRK